MKTSPLPLLLLFLLLAPMQTQAQQEGQRPTVAVVLSGGGAKGMAHISALRAVEEAGIPIDIVCGTSIGSLIGALYCVGYSTDFLDSLVRAQDWTTLLSDRTDPSTLNLDQRTTQNTYAIIRGLSSERTQQGGLIRGRNLDALFRRLCEGYTDSISFDSLPVRFGCVATDIVDNSEVDFRSGSLVQAMRASMAIPGVFTPVRMGQRVLIDGGLKNNYPADLARRMGADIIIGVTVQGEPLEAEKIADAASVLNQIIDVYSKGKYEENIRMSDVMMHVDVSGYSAASFTPSAVDTLIRRGAEEAARHREELLELRRRIGDASLPCLAVPTADSLSAVALGRKRTAENRTRRLVPLLCAGFRFDSEEMGAILIGLKLPIGTENPMSLDAAMRLGSRLGVRAEYSLRTRRVFSPTTAYSFENNTLDVYTLGTRTYNVKYRRHEVDISPINFELKNMTLRAGLRWEYYDYYGQLLSVSGATIDATDHAYLSYHASADLNTESHWYFPTRGTRFHADYTYHTDNLIGLDGGIGLHDIGVGWRVNFSPLPRLTIQPMVYSRLLLGGSVPLCYGNAVGGEWFGHYIRQQMPFAGIGHIEYMERLFAAAQLQLQYRILQNHYVLLRLSTGHHTDKPNTEVLLPSLFGVQAGYSYNTIFGPIEARLGYSNRTESLYFYINIGHNF